MPKQGSSFNDVATLAMNQARYSEDFKVNTAAATMLPNGLIEAPNGVAYEPTAYAHGQIADRLEIPTKYYNRMRETQPDLLAENVNTWFKAQPERRMLRTVTIDRPVLRAFLSDRYRRIDNWDLLNAIVPTMQADYGMPLVPVSTEITETRMYLKFVAPHTERDLKTLLKPGTHTFVNEPIRSGFIIQNSEVGAGAISVFPYTEILRCTNGAIVTDFGTKKYHSGKRQGGDDDLDIEKILSDETKATEDRALFLKVKDIIRACLDDNKVLDIYRKVAETREVKIEAAPEVAIERMRSKFNLSEDEGQGMLRTLIDSGMGLNGYGLYNALTEVAKGQLADISYDRATELEAMAGKLISLPASEWKTLTAKN